MTNHDVYAFGVVSSSTLYSIAGEFPAPEGYAEIDELCHMTGGEAANSSIVLSRLGATVKLDGSWLGDDDGGQRTKAILDAQQVDTSRLPLRENCRGAREVVFAAQDTRTIFGTYGRLQERRQWNTPNDSDVVQAKVICLDPFFGEASLRVAEIGAGAGIPVVTVDCRHDHSILRHAAAVVISESYVRENYPQRSLEDLFGDFRRQAAGLVIMTFGGGAIRYGRRGAPARTAQPYAVEAIDTTGAGDSFRAGIAYGFLQGWDDDRMIDFASAIAAMVCMRFPGVLNSPTLDEVARFMSGEQAPDRNSS